MVEWFQLNEPDFFVSWHALQWIGISSFVELFDPTRPDFDLNLGLSRTLFGCFNPIREWAKNEMHKRSEEGKDKMGIWEIFRQLRPEHIEIEKKIRYARRFWSRLFRIQCMSLKALEVF